MFVTMSNAKLSARSRKQQQLSLASLLSVLRRTIPSTCMLLLLAAVAVLLWSLSSLNVIMLVCFLFSVMFCA